HILRTAEYSDAVEYLHADPVDPDAVFHRRRICFRAEHPGEQDRRTAGIYLAAAEPQTDDLCDRRTARVLFGHRLFPVCRHSAHFGIDREYHPDAAERSQ